MDDYFWGFIVELRDLLKKYDYSIGADIEGDTHGIQTNFVAWKNSFHQSDGEILSFFSSTIDHHDLDEFIKTNIP